jgi:hypothetical protein
MERSSPDAALALRDKTPPPPAIAWNALEAWAALIRINNAYPQKGYSQESYSSPGTQARRHAIAWRTGAKAGVIE